MKKKVLKFVLIALAGIALLELGVYLVIHWPKQTNDVAVMESTRYPAVRITGAGGGYSELQPFSAEMQAASMRNSITPLDGTRAVNVAINTYENEIDGMKYEIRSLDGSRLIDSVEVDNLPKENVESITVPLTLTNLLEEGSEYALVIKMETGEKVLYYYGRVVYGSDLHVQELLEYVQNFSSATFDKSTTNKTIVNIIRKDDTMENDTLSYVNIHSDFDTITWGNMAPSRTQDPKISITDLTTDQMSVTLSYPVTAVISGTNRSYNVTETFCVRYRSGSISMLEYERYTNQQLVIDEMSMSGNSISLGIGDGQCQIKSPEDKTITAFVYDGQLWLQDSKTNTVSCIFTCAQPDSDSSQNGYADPEVRIINVNDNKDINFVVYGYQQSGSSEASVGVTVYRYHGQENNIEELFNIPLTVSDTILKQQFGNLLYLNESDIFYFQYSSTLYQYNIGENKLEEIVTLDNADDYFISEDGSCIAWEGDSEDGLCHTIEMLRTSSGERISKAADDGTYFQIGAFLNNDLVYGIGRTSELVTESGVIAIAPMYGADIFNVETQTVRSHYEKEGIYLSALTVGESSITFQRLQRQDDGSYAAITDDTLLSNAVSETETVSKVTSGTTDQRKKEYYLKLPQPAVANPAITADMPRIQVKGDIPSLELRDNFAEEENYYVYGYGGEFLCTKSMKEAIETAYGNRGVVVSNTQQYLWRRMFRASSKLLKIDELPVTSEEETLDAVLQIVAAYEDVDINAQSGNSIIERLQSILPGHVMNLYGCSLEDVLYYVNLDSPVIIVTGDHSALLITGYTADSVTIYDPLQNQYTKLSMAEAEAAFTSYGNNFVSYVN